MKFTGLTCVLMLSFNASSIWAEEQTDAYATHHELGLQQGFPPPQEKQVTQDNALISAPFNRYSYQNMREFYPTVNIPPSSNPRPLKVFNKLAAPQEPSSGSQRTSPCIILCPMHTSKVNSTHL